MAEFQEVARHWKRMCKQYQKPNTCHGCPIAEHQKMFEACSDGDVDTVAMEALVMAWAAENPEPVYPTWEQAIAEIYLRSGRTKYSSMMEWEINEHIPADIAQKLGIEPKEG